MGYIYRKKRKLPDGTFKEDSIWTLKFYDHGREIRQSSGTDNYNDAKVELKRLEGLVADSKPLPETRKLFSHLLDDVINDYRDNGRKTFSSTKQRIEKRIKPALGHRKVKDITTATIRDYRNQRLTRDKAKPGTVNREL